jgi:hypothetical protein
MLILVYITALELSGIAFILYISALVGFYLLSVYLEFSPECAVLNG